MIINRPENELLLCCATTFGGPEKVSRIGKLTQGGINWSHLIGMARRNGVMPLLYWNLKKIDFEAIPETVFKEICDEYRINVIRNLMLTGRLFSLLDLFQDNDISCIPYKGPTLSVLAYGDIALRHFVDLDFIVHKNDVIRAKQLLLSEGYRPEYSLPRDQEVAYLQHECEYNFFHDKTRMLIELHWGIVQKYFSCHFDINKLWTDLRPVSVLNRQVITVSPEPLLLILCLHHGAKHQWGSLGWICDIAQLVRVCENLNWDSVLDQAFRSGVNRILFLGLSLAKEMLGADIPNEVDKRLLEDRAIPPLAEEVQKQIFSVSENMLRESERFLLHLRMRENLKDKAAYCLGRLFTSTQNDWPLLKLPTPLFPFYCLLRPFRLVKKFGRQALGLV